MTLTQEPIAEENTKCRPQRSDVLSQNNNLYPAHRRAELSQVFAVWLQSNWIIWKTSNIVSGLHTTFSPLLCWWRSCQTPLTPSAGWWPGPWESGGGRWRWWILVSGCWSSPRQPHYFPLTWSINICLAGLPLCSASILHQPRDGSRLGSTTPARLHHSHH